MQNNEPKIIIVVALYDPNENEIKNVMRYIKACEFCILMDDSETDNGKWILEYFKNTNFNNYLYVWNKENIGLCASVNRGIEIAKGKDASWVLLMNGDSIMTEKDVLVLKDYVRNNDTSNISCIAPQYNYDRHIRKPYRGIKKILWANMSGMCIKINTLEKIGLFDERLFIDGLDIEWGIRSKRLGYEMYEIGESIMDHHPAETRKLKLFGKEILLYGWASPVRYYYQFRANYYMIRKYHSFEALKWQAIKLLKVILLFDNKKEYLRMYIKAHHDCKNNVWGRLLK